MNNFSRQILNYFAAFTETKFRFGKLTSHQWGDNEFMLPLDVFEDFNTKIIESLKGGSLENIVIKKEEYSISISKDDFSTEMVSIVEGSRNFFEEKIRFELNETASNNNSINLSADGLGFLKEDNSCNDFSIQQEKICIQEGTRKYNLWLRDEAEKVLLKLIDKKKEEIKQNYNIRHLPSININTSNVIKNLFDDLQNLFFNQVNFIEYPETVKNYFKKFKINFIIYDLFYNLQKFYQFQSAGITYMFFHELYNEEEVVNSFPLYFITTDIIKRTNEIEINFPNKLIFINTPAINHFEYENVLATARATAISSALETLNSVEVFLQTQYQCSEPFILETNFRDIISEGDKYPKIRSRMGIQTVSREDGQFLDYSEIIVDTETGKKNVFSELVGKYINGEVESNQDSVDKEYRETYPINSCNRYVSNNPLPLNNSQKRILLALKNERNKIVVVDGPPGTGKSHTIAAISYWANQNNKSLVITSHKKEALDVVERMIEEKFKNLHPNAKPSLIRMDNSSDSVNRLSNTLQNAVISSAGDRANNFNEATVKSSAEEIKSKFAQNISNQLAVSFRYEEKIKKLFEFEKINSFISDNGNLDDLLPSVLTVPFGENIDFDVAKGANFQSLKSVSLLEFAFLLKNKKEIPNFLEACDRLCVNNIDAIDNIGDVVINESLKSAFKKLFNYLDVKKPIKEFNKNVVPISFLKKIFRKSLSREDFKKHIEEIESIKNMDTLSKIAQIVDKNIDEINLYDIGEGLKILEGLVAIKPYVNLISAYKAVLKQDNLSFVELYQRVSTVEKNTLLSEKSLGFFEKIFKYYSSVLEKINVNQCDLSSFSNIYASEYNTKLWQWIKLHYDLSQIPDDVSCEQENNIDDYYFLNHKIVEHQNDVRFRNLNNFVGKIAQIKEIYSHEKRFSLEQAKILLDNVSCIIASPEMISKSFPMEEQMIDLLVFDEASQVSIAESISLILRAKQVVVFGDEYQYGAVGAVNVSKKYASGYFQEIINAYGEDFNKKITDSEKDKLLGEIITDVEEGNEVAEKIINPKDIPGSMLWLKTFNIRTSTLSFAKAIANYSASLREHFRSFPEVIGYSNEFFYKPAQLELTVNRIRTKPIKEVLRFIKVDVQGDSGPNVNYDEIDTIINDISQLLANGFVGSIGIITSFREQQIKIEKEIGERLNLQELKNKHKLAIWFVGDVQGEERDIIYYSFVQSENFNNADLRTIYPVVGGEADDIKKLKMQRLNVGFSRAKDTMVFVHSMPIEKYSNTRLGDALKYYKNVLEKNEENDAFISDLNVFESPAEKELYSLLIQTNFYKENQRNIKIIPQFKIGEYIRKEYHKYIPKFRTDFLFVYSSGGKEQALIIEYDGVEFHFNDPSVVTNANYNMEYLEYDKSRQLELESYGYKFLRINKFNLRPQNEGETKVGVLNKLITNKIKI